MTDAAENAEADKRLAAIDAWVAKANALRASFREMVTQFE
jgi:hypothetical protein